MIFEIDLAVLDSVFETLELYLSVQVPVMAVICDVFSAALQRQNGITRLS